jgi:hypothetical protein
MVNRGHIRKPKSYRQPQMDCLCEEVAYEDSLTFFTQAGRVILVAHKDCPEHGIVCGEVTEPNADAA